MRDNCLKPFYVSQVGRSRPIELHFHMEKALIDLSCLFDKAFKNHESNFGPPDYPRIEKQKNKVIYRFTLIELIEAFCGDYSPTELANYLHQHLTDETLESEVLVNLVKRSRRSIKFVYPRFYGMFSRRYHLGPINFSINVLDRILEHNSLKRRVMHPGKDYLYKSPLDWLPDKKCPMEELKGNDLSRKSIRSALRDAEKNIAILLPYGSLPEKLHDISVVSYFRMPMDGL